MESKNWIIWFVFWCCFALLQLAKPYETSDRLWIFAAFYIFGANIVNFFLSGPMKYTGDTLDSESNFFHRLLRLAVSVFGFILVIKNHV